MIVDALGLPLEFALTEGQRHDVQAAPALVTVAGSQCLLGDKGYDSAAFRAHPTAMRCVAQVPSKADRTVRFPLDRELYKTRSEVAC